MPVSYSNTDFAEGLKKKSSTGDLMGLGGRYDFNTREKKIVPGPGSYSELNTIAEKASKKATASPLRKELAFGVSAK